MTRTWYRVALGHPSGAAPTVVAAAGEHMGVAIAAAERHTPGAFAIAVEPAPDADIPLGESLGKSGVVELGAATGVPVFRWPVGALPQLSRAAGAAGAARGWTIRPAGALFVVEAQTDAEHLTDLFLGMIERLPSADNLEVKLLEHFEEVGRADVWLTSRVDGKRILRFLDDYDTELLDNGHLELSIYVRAKQATLRLTEHKTVVWIANDRALEGEVARWLGELAVPRVDQPALPSGSAAGHGQAAAGGALVTVKDVPHYHYRAAGSRDRKKLADELYRQRLRRVDTVKPRATGS